MCIQKEIIPEKGICRIKFSVTDTLIDHPKEVALLGDFNNWNPRKDKMIKSKNGFFEKLVEHTKALERTMLKELGKLLP